MNSWRKSTDMKSVVGKKFIAKPTTICFTQNLKKEPTNYLKLFWSGRLTSWALFRYNDIILNALALLFYIMLLYYTRRRRATVELAGAKAVGKRRDEKAYATNQCTTGEKKMPRRKENENATKSHKINVYLKIIQTIMWLISSSYNIWVHSCRGVYRTAHFAIGVLCIYIFMYMALILFMNVFFLFFFFVFSSYFYKPVTRLSCAHKNRFSRCYTVVYKNPESYTRRDGTRSKTCILDRWYGKTKKKNVWSLIVCTGCLKRNKLLLALEIRVFAYCFGWLVFIGYKQSSILNNLSTYYNVDYYANIIRDTLLLLYDKS